MECLHVLQRGPATEASPPVRIEPGETAQVDVALRARAFARWDPSVHDWVVDPGDYELSVAASAVDVRSTLLVSLG